MRWLRDATGRFPRRPHYETDELESVCADLRLELHQVRSTREAAITTDDLSVLVEHHAADLDLYAELAPEFDGVTDFARDARPRIRIAARLASQARFAHRLRTTLAHELAHVVLHNFIWWFDPGVAFDPHALSPRCALRTRSVDWMEWQANYCAGALLVPASQLESVAEPVWERSSRGRALIRSVQARFEVSAQVATIRLRQLGRLSERPVHVVRTPVPRSW
ncbi:MAG: ImmA/IrrE family metallo-endopeptidase [Chloroflexi bacterium]|nr:ImmA/IrrE family metallo-endopeptidase [Chloroflexota bacterium]